MHFMKHEGNCKYCLSLTVCLFQNGLNALHLASKEGHVNIVTELLKRGANVDAATKVSREGLTQAQETRGL